MQRHRESAATFAARVPVALLALTIATSALHASCTSDTEGTVATVGVEVDAGDDGGSRSDAGPGGAQEPGRVPADASVGFPSDSMDSPDDRSDGMSYGDGYGAVGAHDRRDAGTSRGPADGAAPDAEADGGTDGVAPDAEAYGAPDAADAGE
jgi:hypothetical protein